MILIRTLFIRAIGRCYVSGTYCAAYEPFQLSRISRFYHAATSKIYRDLDHTKNEIRVIEIEPGQWNDDIRCRLKVVSLDRLLRPRYDTLSYNMGQLKEHKSDKSQQTDYQCLNKPIYGSASTSL